MSYEQILSEQRGAVALITLNRPEKLNAWSGTLQAELRQAITAANENPDIGAIVLTGAGRAYCAGADISAWQRDLKGEGNSGLGFGTDRPQAGAGSNWVQFIRAAKPVIAAVNGHAVGVGATHILPADIRIASEQAKFGFVFVKMGVVPELASSYYLVQLIGLGAAQELVLTARMIDAEEALRLGLVSRVVPHERLLDEALALGEHIASLPPAQLRMVKELFTQNAVETDLDTVMQREGEALRRAYASPEFKEAVTAFMEKRQPNFRAVQTV
jgi:2-(1,2-epoxy-1,2-dihydrophenyl)acetyl-CoA isomerase